MTRPSRSLNWYDPALSGIVPAGGRWSVTFPACPGTAYTGSEPAWYPATYPAPRPTTPRLGDQAVPAGHLGAAPAADHKQVVLPDRNVGCSMADMADLDSVEEAWEALEAVTDVTRVVPITYMNSSAALKAFVGRQGGAVCTSSNARAVLTWALGRGDKVLFFPDQHLGRNTAYQLGFA